MILAGRFNYSATLLLLLCSLPCEAHNRSQSFSFWNIENNHVQLLFTLGAREVTRLQNNGEPLESTLIRHLQNTIVVSRDQINCQLNRGYSALSAAPGYLRVKATFNCPTTGNKSSAMPTIISIQSFFDIVSSHVHHARISHHDRPPLEYLYTAKQQQYVIDHKAIKLATGMRHLLTQYMALGMTHIFGGLDHLAFLLALLLLSARLRDIIWMVSGFTLGHSITLSLAVLQWVTPSSAVIEALIGFTIALVAAENIGSRTGSNHKIAYAAALMLALMALSSLFSVTELGLPIISIMGLILLTTSYLPLSQDQASAIKLRPILTLAFGLIHGFAFASVLQGIGLPSQQLWPALLGFNIGVELGQILIVGLIGYGAQRLATATLLEQQMLARDVLSACLCGLGLYWFIARSYGL